MADDKLTPEISFSVKKGRNGYQLRFNFVFNLDC